tara:strand:- start:1140 stop:1550 length:411 start_codon:yes stop_codon:yes gene_type:complete
MSEKISYRNITRNIEKQKNQEESEINYSGWTVLNKSSLKKLKEIKEKKQKQKEENLKKYSLEDWYSLCIKLSSNWDKYRDTQNELLGDRSPYIDYKNDIQKIVDEENYIQEEIYKIQNNYYLEYDSDNNSDNEQYK